MRRCPRSPPARSRRRKSSSSFISKSRFLILDEPTSVLTPNEADEILGMIRDMAHAGRITVLIITHKFREVMAFADDVSVLRRGKLVGGGRVADLTPDDHGQDDDRRPGNPRPWAAAAGGGRARCAWRLRDLAADDDEGLPCRARRLARPCAPARSSASPASPATARASWCRCLAASATRPPARCWCMASPITRGAPRCCATRCRCCRRSRCATPACRA